MSFPVILRRKVRSELWNAAVVRTGLKRFFTFDSLILDLKLGTSHSNDVVISGFSLACLLAA